MASSDAMTGQVIFNPLKGAWEYAQPVATSITGKTLYGSSAIETPASRATGMGGQNVVGQPSGGVVTGVPQPEPKEPPKVGSIVTIPHDTYTEQYQVLPGGKRPSEYFGKVAGVSGDGKVSGDWLKEGDKFFSYYMQPTSGSWVETFSGGSTMKGAWQIDPTTGKVIGYDISGKGHPYFGVRESEGWIPAKVGRGAGGEQVLEPKETYWKLPSGKVVPESKLVEYGYTAKGEPTTSPLKQVVGSPIFPKGYKEYGTQDVLRILVGKPTEAEQFNITIGLAEKWKSTVDFSWLMPSIPGPPAKRTATNEELFGAGFPSKVWEKFYGEPKMEAITGESFMAVSKRQVETKPSPFLVERIAAIDWIGGPWREAEKAGEAGWPGAEYLAKGFIGVGVVAAGEVIGSQLVIPVALAVTHPSETIASFFPKITTQAEAERWGLGTLAFIGGAYLGGKTIGGIKQEQLFWKSEAKYGYIRDVYLPKELLVDRYGFEPKGGMKLGTELTKVSFGKGIEKLQFDLSNEALMKSLERPIKTGLLEPTAPEWTIGKGGEPGSIWKELGILEAEKFIDIYTTGGKGAKGFGVDYLQLKGFKVVFPEVKTFGITENVLALRAAQLGQYAGIKGGGAYQMESAMKGIAELKLDMSLPRFEPLSELEVLGKSLKVVGRFQPIVEGTPISLWDEKAVVKFGEPVSELYTRFSMEPYHILEERPTGWLAGGGTAKTPLFTAGELIDYALTDISKVEFLPSGKMVGFREMQVISYIPSGELTAPKTMYYTAPRFDISADIMGKWGETASFIKNFPMLVPKPSYGIPKEVIPYTTPQPSEVSAQFILPKIGEISVSRELMELLDITKQPSGTKELPSLFDFTGIKVETFAGLKSLEVLGTKEITYPRTIEALQPLEAITLKAAVTLQQLQVTATKQILKPLTPTTTQPQEEWPPYEPPTFLGGGFGMGLGLPKSKLWRMKGERAKGRPSPLQDILSAQKSYMLFGAATRPAPTKGILRKWEKSFAGQIGGFKTVELENMPRMKMPRIKVAKVRLFSTKRRRKR